MFCEFLFLLFMVEVTIFKCYGNVSTTHLQAISELNELYMFGLQKGVPWKGKRGGMKRGSLHHGRNTPLAEAEAEAEAEAHPVQKTG